MSHRDGLKETAPGHGAIHHFSVSGRAYEGE